MQVIDLTALCVDAWLREAGLFIRCAPYFCLRLEGTDRQARKQEPPGGPSDGLPGRVSGQCGLLWEALLVETDEEFQRITKYLLQQYDSATQGFVSPRFVALRRLLRLRNPPIEPNQARLLRARWPQRGPQSIHQRRSLACNPRQHWHLAVMIYKSTVSASSPRAMVFAGGGVTLMPRSQQGQSYLARRCWMTRTSS
jgi:hypothetical protein